MKEILHIYTRVSSAVQEEGTSLETQKELGIKKSKELGMKYQIWNEGAASSHHENLTNRPKISELLFDIEKGNIKHLFVYNNDRLSRNDQTQFFIKNAIIKNGVMLYTKDGTYDLNNPTDKLLKSFLDGVAEYDNAIRAERTRLGKLNKVRNGGWYGAPPPYGYELVDGDTTTTTTVSHELVKSMSVDARRLGRKQEVAKKKEMNQLTPEPHNNITVE